MNKETFLQKSKEHVSYGEPYYAVYDNFLPYQEFGLLKSYCTSNLGWQISGKINSNDTSNNDFYLSTQILNNQKPAREQWSETAYLDPFLSITSKIFINSLFRIKANLYVKGSEPYIHAPHIDYSFHHQGALFYVTSCNAPTYMADGTEIESIENRLLLFNSASPHSSSTPTDVPYRITINMNYFGAGPLREYLHDAPNSLPTLKSANYPKD
jgi:hypothetical protein|tara:strand:+ start:2403 stop:3038 length:636 start_codon:yes stop_codon:yes gene_type:complete